MKIVYKRLALSYLGSSLFSAAAKTLVLIPIGHANIDDGSEPNWNLAYIGAGCALVAIPFKLAFNRNAKKAIEFYNSGYTKTTSLDFKLGMKPNGMLLSMTF